MLCPAAAITSAGGIGKTPAPADVCEAPLSEIAKTKLAARKFEMLS